MSHGSRPVQGDGESVDKILADPDGDLHFAVGCWERESASKPVDDDEQVAAGVSWEELQGLEEGGTGYGKALAMEWDERGHPTMVATYHGYFREGKPDGHGRVELEDGGCYLGQMHRGHSHGQGKSTYPDRAQYWGAFELDERGCTGGGVGGFQCRDADTPVYGYYCGDELLGDHMGGERLLAENDPLVEAMYLEVEKW